MKSATSGGGSVSGISTSEAGPVPSYLQPGRLGPLALKNRLVRAATSETMATDAGEVTAELVAFYERLARGGAGLIITGHVYVTPRGQCSPRQMASTTDARVPGLRPVDRSRACRRRPDLRRALACRQPVDDADRVPLAPSVITNPIYARHPGRGQDGDIADIIRRLRRRRAPGEVRPVSTASTSMAATAT